MPRLLLSPLLLVLLPGFATAGPSTETYRFEHQIDFTNHPVKNRFVISKQGTLTRHALGEPSGEHTVLRELHVTETNLEKAQLNGAEVPVELIKAQAPDLFGRPSRSLAVETFDLERGTFGDQRAIDRVVSQQYADHVILESLIRFCERDWPRIREHARGATEVDAYSTPALYAALTFTELVEGDTRLITITNDAASGPALGTGSRTLRAFRFEGRLEQSSGRFLSLAASATVFNEAKQLEQQLTYAQTLETVQATVPSKRVAPLRALCAAVALGEAGDLPAALEAYAALEASAELSEAAEEQFARWQRAAEGVQWVHRDLESALAEAKTRGWPVLVLFDQENCPPCAILKKTVIQRAEFVEAVRSDVVLLNLNACTDEAQAKRFKLAGTPTLLLLDAEGNELGRQVGIKGLAGSLQFLREGLTRFTANPPRKRYF